MGQGNGEIMNGRKKIIQSKSNVLNIVTVIVMLTCFISNIKAQRAENIIGNTRLDTVKVLFLGSSYFNYNNLPDLFDNLALLSGKDVYVDQYIPGGLYLSDHASSSITEAKINEQNWDFVILQEVGRLTAYPDYF